jgi:hypothetical protein
LPAEGIASFPSPSSRATETAQERPRALNEPVGLRLSSLIQSWAAPSASPMRDARTSGVMPSPSETIDDGL